jgi:acyl-ACP thioesterase
VREAPADRLVPRPIRGRTFAARRPVRGSQVSPGGRLRLDAIADMLQDLSGDDSDDLQAATTVGPGSDLSSQAWVVRRTTIEVRSPATFREVLDMTTWCSGLGSRWAERRISMVGDRGASIETASLWVHVDAAEGRILTLPDGFEEVYGEASGGREVTSRLQHDPALPEPARRAATEWALRLIDFDVLGHVNNTVVWAMVEEVRSGEVGPTWPLRAEVEYRLPIERDDQVRVAIDRSAAGSGELRAWIFDPTRAKRVYATAKLFALEVTAG